jgi:ribulose-5-phosphate 4-epimerase/fuculose-1-phosphate aldolase
MFRDPELSQFIHLCLGLGATEARVQGSAGNTSLKNTDGRMLIKASGRRLSEMDSPRAQALVDYQRLRQSYAEGPPGSAQLYEDLVRSATLGDERASMESGMHALLGRCVLHTHPAQLLVLLCASSGEERLRELLPDAHWVPYCAPGSALTAAVAGLDLDPDLPQIILLQNHGLLISHPQISGAGRLQEQVEARVRSWFGRGTEYPPMSAGEVAGVTGEIFFPDQAVFSMADSPYYRENQRLAAFVARELSRMGLKPHTLSAGEVSELLGLESEKFRRSQEGAC